MSTLSLYTMLALVKYMAEPKKKSPYQRVSPENMERVEKIGKFGESFDDVLGRLLDYWEKADED